MEFGAYCSQCQRPVLKTAIECPYCGYHFASRGHTSRQREARRKKSENRTRTIVIFLVLCAAVFFYVSSQGIKLPSLWKYQARPAGQELPGGEKVDRFATELGDNMYAGPCEVKGIIISGQTPRVKIDQWWFQEGKAVCGGKISAISISKVSVKFADKEARFKVGDIIEPPKK